MNSLQILIEKKNTKNKIKTELFLFCLISLINFIIGIGFCRIL